MIIKCDVVIDSFYYFLRLYVRPFLALWRSRPNYALFNLSAAVSELLLLENDFM